MAVRIIKSANEVYEVKNAQFLPFFYLIPKKIVNEKKMYLELPRNPMKAVLDRTWREIIDNDDFILTVGDSVASLIWGSFKVNPYIHCFSGYDPLFKLAYMLHLWEEALIKMSFTAIEILKLPTNVELPWLSMEQAQDMFYMIGRYAIKKYNLQPVINCIKKNRCHEDYDARMSNLKIDFYRKWYHSRAATKVVSLEALIENNYAENHNGEEYYEMIDQVSGMNSLTFEDILVYGLDLERYKKTLHPVDSKIFSLKSEGYTQSEIAKKLKFKTHSTISKRINGEIKKGYIEYFGDY